MRATRPTSAATAGAAVVIPAATVKPGGGSLFHRSATRRITRLRRSVRSIAPRSASMPGHRSTISCSFSSACSQCLARSLDSPTASRRRLGSISSTSSASSARARSAAQPQRLGRARPPPRTIDARVSDRSSRSIAGGIGASSTGSSAPPMRSSSSGSPTRISRGSRRPAPALAHEGFGEACVPHDCWAGGCGPVRGPASPVRSGGSTRRRAHRRTSGATGW